MAERVYTVNYDRYNTDGERLDGGCFRALDAIFDEVVELSGANPIYNINDWIEKEFNGKFRRIETPNPTPHLGRGETLYLGYVIDFKNEDDAIVFKLKFGV